jgi:GNAT superfamily N-acetyltransferase
MDRPAAAPDVRRVGFRSGSIEELAAQHVVDSEIESERNPGSGRKPFEAYVSFARSLPSRFDDHTWVAEDEDGTPAGCAACWSDAAGDPRSMESYVYVRLPWRRRGLGRRLGRAVVEEAASLGISKLVWSSYDTIAAGEDFSRRVGGRVGRVNRTSELVLEGLDWERVESWVAEGPRRAVGYRLEYWEGPLPEHVLDDAARVQRLVNAQPRDDLEVGDVNLNASQAAEVDRHLSESGRLRWTLFIRDPGGRCVGGTELTFEPWDPATARQQNTATDPGHRGRGLAKWAKAAMLLRLRSERPDVLCVRTSNAFSNEAMLAINAALGFDVVEVRTEWQGLVAEMRGALARYVAIGGVDHS